MLRTSLLAAACLLTGLAAARADAPKGLDITTRPITRFAIGSDQTRFGGLEFTGGLEMVSGDRDLGALSAFRFTSPGKAFFGIADTGFWFWGEVEHDQAGAPSGITSFRMQEMQGPDGAPSSEKWLTDGEGLAISGDVITASFERKHRISQYKLGPEGVGPALRNLGLVVPAGELRQNRGFEALMPAPQDGPLGGALVAVSEKSLDPKGDIYAAILSGPQKGIFTVARSGEFDITDGAFLPSGDLVILERSFSMAQGVRMRMRRIAGDSVKKGARVDGPVLIEADMAYQIDNMEGLDIWTRADGATMLSLMSDDNHSILQRNLYLEFRLAE